MPEDGEVIYQIHSESILTLCAADYPQDVVKMWAAEKTAEFYRQTIEQEREIIHVAELDSRVVGFVSRSDNFLNALYLSPEAKGMGIGKKLLQFFEKNVIELGFSEIKLTSTITALPFYRHAGFQLLEETAHRLDGGLEITCFRMNKVI